jgi:hypothetical protein
VEQNNDGMSTDGNANGEEVMTHQQTNRAGAAVVKTKRNNRGRDPAVNNSNYGWLYGQDISAWHIRSCAKNKTTGTVLCPR